MYNPVFYYLLTIVAVFLCTQDPMLALWRCRRDMDISYLFRIVAANPKATSKYHTQFVLFLGGRVSLPTSKLRTRVSMQVEQMKVRHFLWSIDIIGLGVSRILTSAIFTACPGAQCISSEEEVWSPPLRKLSASSSNLVVGKVILLPFRWAMLLGPNNMYPAYTTLLNSSPWNSLKPSPIAQPWNVFSLLNFLHKKNPSSHLHGFPFHRLAAIRSLMPCTASFSPTRQAIDALGRPGWLRQKQIRRGKDDGRLSLQDGGPNKWNPRTSL